MAELNTEPRFTREPDIQGTAVIGPSANTAFDGTGANITSIFQADTTSGGFVSKVRFKAAGSPAATVARLFICSVTGTFTPGTSNTSANTWLFEEVALPAITSSQVDITSNDYEMNLNIALPPGYRLLAAFGTSTGAAGTGYKVTTIAGKY